MQSASLQTFHWGRSKAIAQSAYGRPGGALLLQPSWMLIRQADKGFTRMSLTGYSSAGRSPPEPASASPVEENRFIWIDLGCLKKRRLKLPWDWGVPENSAGQSPADSVQAGGPLRAWLGGDALWPTRLDTRPAALH